MSILAIDTETTGVDFYGGCEVFFVSTVDGKGNIVNWEWDVDPHTRKALIVPKERTQIEEYVNEFDELIFHNAEFDVQALEFAGIEIDWNKVHDTMLLAHLYDSQTAGEDMSLKRQALVRVRYSDEDEEILRKTAIKARRIGKKYGWAITDPAVKNPWKNDMWLPKAVHDFSPEPEFAHWDKVLRTYAVGDVERTLCLFLFYKRVLKDVWERYEERRKLLPIVAAMKDAGMPVRPDLEKVLLDKKAKRKKYLRNIRRVTKNPHFNPNSPHHLEEKLFKLPRRLGGYKMRPAGWTAKGHPSTKREALEAMLEDCREDTEEYRFLKYMIGYRQSGKAADYLREYQAKLSPSLWRDSRWRVIRPQIIIPGSGTLRFATQNPNGQNISAKGRHNLRAVFGPPPSHVMAAIDYQNLELRLFAWFTGDKRLIEAFERGESVHMVIAEKLWGKGIEKDSQEYKWTKNGNFSLIYGASDRRADATYHRKGAAKLIRSEFPLIDMFLRKEAEHVKEHGYVLTAGGYPLRPPPDQSYAASNYKIQGTAGEIICRAMIKLAVDISNEDADCDLLMQIHDELLFIMPRDEHVVERTQRYARIMEEAGEYTGASTPVDPQIITESWNKPISIKDYQNEYDQAS